MWKFFKKADKEPKEKNPLLHTYMTSLLSLVLCVSMFFGTSYAWFTSEVENTGNEIYIGTLEAGLEIKKLDGTKLKELWSSDPEKASIVRWEPGYTSLRTLTVKNTGDLAFKYNLSFILTKAQEKDKTEITNEADIKAITDQFVVYVYDGTYNKTDKTYADITTANGWTEGVTLTEALKGHLLSGSVTKEENKDTETFTIALHMKEDADSSLMGKSLTTWSWKKDSD